MIKSRNNNCLLSIPSLYQQKTSYLTISDRVTHRSKDDTKLFPTALPIAFNSTHKAIHSFLSQPIPKFSTINTQRKTKQEKGTLLSNRTVNKEKPISILRYKTKSSHVKASLFPEYNVLAHISQDFIKDNKRSSKENEWRIRLVSSKPSKPEDPFYSAHSNLTTSRTHKTKKILTLKPNEISNSHMPLLTPYFTKKQKRKREADHSALINRQKNDYYSKVSDYLNAEFLPIQGEMSKHNHKQIQSLNHEIDFKTNEDFEIINPKQFSSDYRFNFELISQKKRHLTLNNPMIQRIAKQYNLNHLLEDYSLRGEVKKKVDVILVDEKAKRNRVLLEKWKKAIIKSAIHFQRLNISLKDFYNMKKHNIKPYEHEKTYLFFQAIKDDDIITVTKMLKTNTSLAYDYDHFHQTMLHWMAKRNKYKMISFAVKKGANINAEDIAGRTPLHVAVLLNNTPSVMILLYELANPFACDKDGKRPIDLTADRTVIFILKRVVLLYYLHTIGKTKLFESNIRRGLMFLYINELRLNFNALKFNY